MPTNTLAPTDESNRAMRFGFVALVGGCCAVSVAIVILIWSSVTTASARFSGSTSNESSLFEAAVVDVIVGSPDADVTELRIDAEGLYPGLVVERCLPVRFSGSIDDVAIRLIGQKQGGSGLEDFVRTEVQIGTGTDNECTDFVPEQTAFQGTLGELWSQHGDFANGLDILEAATDGDTATVRIQVEVESDDRAQGLTSEFSVLIEARP